MVPQQIGIVNKTKVIKMAGVVEPNFKAEESAKELYAAGQRRMGETAVAQVNYPG